MQISFGPNCKFQHFGVYNRFNVCIGFVIIVCRIKNSFHNLGSAQKTVIQKKLKSRSTGGHEIEKFRRKRSVRGSLALDLNSGKTTVSKTFKQVAICRNNKTKLVITIYVTKYAISDVYFDSKLY